MLANKLKECRRIKGVSQATAADFFDVAMTTYASWEQGRSEPPLLMLAKIAEYFDTSTDYLLGISKTDNSADHVYRQIASLSEDDRRTLLKIIAALADSTKEHAR